MSKDLKFIGEFEQLILLAILHVKNRSYGIEISSTLDEKCGREVSLGALYTTLSRMEAKGLVTSEMGEASAQRGGKAKKY
ncbi:MAG: PadR family transcriptional regulator, partial [Pseudomonadota bacterium]